MLVRDLVVKVLFRQPWVMTLKMAEKLNCQWLRVISCNCLNVICYCWRRRRLCRNLSVSNTIYQVVTCVQGVRDENPLPCQTVSSFLHSTSSFVLSLHLFRFIYFCFSFCVGLSLSSKLSACVLPSFPPRPLCPRFLHLYTVVFFPPTFLTAYP